MSQKVDPTKTGPPLGSSGLPNPENLRCHTFAITLSPKQDITDVTVKQFVDYVKKKVKYAYVITEFGDTNGKKHLHACLCYANPVEKRNIHDFWASKMKRDYDGSVGKYAVLITTMYCHKWYDEYLQKGGDVVLDTYDRDAVSLMFPTMEQQLSLQAARAQPEIRKHIADLLLEYWIERDPSDASFESAVSAIKYRQYVDNLGPYYIDDRKMHQVCWWMYEKRNQIVDLNVSDKNYAAVKTGNTTFVTQEGKNFKQ